MTTISATSILASKHAVTGARVDTMLLRYPRNIHAEFMTHRMFSRNASSSRAIPVEKMIQDVLDDPFVPLHWGENQKGMQADGECDAKVFIARFGHGSREDAWLAARDNALASAHAFAAAGYHKQLVNRLLEPFGHITVVCTATNYSNFFHLRRHPDAEPHMQLLAEAMFDAYERADVQQLELGEWHAPFVSAQERGAMSLGDAIKLSVARCASTSYKTVEGHDMTMGRAIALHDKLVAMTPMHASPCEHQCRADHLWIDEVVTIGQTKHWCYEHKHLHGNLQGFVQYRKTLRGECR